MSLVCAPFYITVSDVPVYRSHIIDLNYSRSIHCCNKCNLSGINNCPSEIHYGQCQPPTTNKPHSLLPVNDHSISTRSIPVSLPHALPAPASSSKLSKSIHHYKVTHSQHNANYDEASKSFSSSASATIIPKTNIIQDKGNGVNNEKLQNTPSNRSVEPNRLPKSLNKSSTSLKTSSKTIPKSKDIPQFYFPKGKPKNSEEINSIIKQISDKVKHIDSKPPNSQDTINRIHFDEVTKILNVPLYWKYLVFLNCGGTENNLSVTRDSIITLWKKVLNSCHNDASKFFYLVTYDKKKYIEPQDLYPLVQDVLETHPGLTFLLSARDFHSRYMATVVYRIFFGINSSWSGRISLHELEKSDLLPIISSLESTDDINTVTQYFSYEHFYVIYCKFWELDDDHDLVINKADLSRHNNFAISERMIERIFSGAVTRSRARCEGLMTYTEFVWFLLAEEDKRHPRSIEYWFRCMDLDGDGILSLYELEYFYQEQLFRMDEMNVEAINFEDCVCQMLDMIKPKEPNKIRLSDLKSCRLVNIFFDTFFNLNKYLEHEQRDPFTNLKDLEEGWNEVSDWDRFAAEAYEILVAEDGSQDNYNENYRDTTSRNASNDYQDDEEAVYENLSTNNQKIQLHNNNNISDDQQPINSTNNNNSFDDSSPTSDQSIHDKAKSDQSNIVTYDSTKYKEYLNGKITDVVEGGGSTNASISATK